MGRESASRYLPAPLCRTFSRPRRSWRRSSPPIPLPIHGADTAGCTFAQLLHRLGLAEVINARATLVDHGFTASTLLDGRADLAVQQMSELMSVPGVRIAGPLPETLQHYTVFSGGTTLPAGEQHDAVALLAFLTTPFGECHVRGCRA